MSFKVVEGISITRPSLTLNTISSPTISPYVVIFGYSPSVEGWVPKVVRGVFRPRSYPTRKRWRCASVFAEPLLTPPETLGGSNGQFSEIAHSLWCNLGMSGIDRLLVGFLCQVVCSPLLTEHT